GRKAGAGRRHISTVNTATSPNAAPLDVLTERATMGVQVREKAGKWYCFTNHRGVRKAKCFGAGDTGHRAATEAAVRLRERVALGELGVLAPPPSASPDFLRGSGVGEPRRLLREEGAHALATIGRPEDGVAQGECAADGLVLGGVEGEID